MTAPTWHNAEIVFVPAVACPHCHATRLITVRSDRGGDGSVSRKSICRRCSMRFVVVIEPAEENSEPLPEFGSDEN